MPDERSAVVDWVLWFEDDDDESLVAVGDDDERGMLVLSLWWRWWCWLWPNVGFNISEIRNDLIFDVEVWFNNDGEQIGEDEFDVDLEYVESGDERNNWWSLPPMMKFFLLFRLFFNIIIIMIVAIIVVVVVAIMSALAFLFFWQLRIDWESNS